VFQASRETARRIHDMRWQSSKTIWRRREVWLLLVGLALVAGTQWCCEWLNREGGVTLEFVGFERRGTNKVEGTIVSFRLRNRSGESIGYYEYSDSLPMCQVLPMIPDEHRVYGSNFKVYAATPAFHLVTLGDGEERIVHAEIEIAEQSWKYQLAYWELGVSNRWTRLLPGFAREKLNKDFYTQPMQEVSSEPVHRLIPKLQSRYDQIPGASYVFNSVQTNKDGRVTGKFGFYLEGLEPGLGGKTRVGD